MIDYSEATASMPTRLAKLTHALNGKKYLEAQSIALGIAKDMADVAILCYNANEKQHSKDLIEVERLAQIKDKNQDGC